MHQTLQVKLAPGLTLTPQLQQAIRLLTLSAQELSNEISTQLEVNPLLEIEEPGETAGDEPDSLMDRFADRDGAAIEEPDSLTDRFADRDGAAIDEPDSLTDIPAELATDSLWEDSYDLSGSDGSVMLTSSASIEESGYEERSASIESLRDHLLWQIDTARFSPKERLIGEVLIDLFDDRGYLITPLTEVGAILESLSPATSSSPEEIEEVLGRIQTFDPTGIGARDLRECLLIQLAEIPPATPGWITAHRLVSTHLDVLGQQPLAALARRMDIPEARLEQALALIRQLHHCPAEQVTETQVDYVVPDLFARKSRGEWCVDLNEALIPKLRINRYYESLIRRGDKSTDMQYLREHLQEARFFLKNLRHRNETLLEIGMAIVALQRDFLERGATGMRPLVLRDVAEMIRMHESTVSRMTTRKYMHTPHGVFELKYFFSSHVGGEGGAEHSAVAIQARLRTLVDAEDPCHPLSDLTLCQLLNEGGIAVARRTVTKYRKLMKIPSSNERRRGG